MFKKTKTTLVVAITLTLILSVSNVFALSDIQNHWAKKHIEKLVNAKMVSGYPDGSFKPEKQMSIAEFIKIVASKYAGKIDLEKSNHWAMPFLNAMIREAYLGVDSKDISGDFRDLKNPVNLDKDITREEIVFVLGNIMTNRGIEVSEESIKFQNSVSDFSKIENLYRAGVILMMENKIIEGYNDGTFRPKKKATRAEVSTMISRFMDKMEEKKLIKEEEANKSIIVTGDIDSKLLIILDLDNKATFETQKKELEEELKNHLTEDEIIQTVNHVKLKKKIDEALPSLEIDSSKLLVKISSAKNTPTIIIQLEKK